MLQASSSHPLTHLLLNPSPSLMEAWFLVNVWLLVNSPRWGRVLLAELVSPLLKLCKMVVLVRVVSFRVV